MIFVLTEVIELWRISEALKSKIRTCRTERCGIECLVSSLSMHRPTLK